MTALRLVDERSDWLAWRRQGIGASDAAAVCGLSPYRTPLMVYLDKLGLISEEMGEEAEWGLRLESAVAAKFEEVSGFRVVQRQRAVEHPERPWQRATLDGLVMADEEEVGVYEGKTAGRWTAPDWEDEDGAPMVPAYHQVQVQHQLAVTGHTVAHVAVLIGGQRFRYFEIERDEKAIEHITAMEAEFWEMVQNQTPPRPDGSDETTRAVRAAFAEADPEKTIELDPAVLTLVRERQAAAAAEKSAKERVKQAQNALALALRDAEAGTVNGRTVVTWKTVEASTLDLDEFRAEHPALAAQYTHANTHRRFGFPKLREV